MKTNTYFYSRVVQTAAGPFRDGVDVDGHAITKMQRCYPIDGRGIIPGAFALTKEGDGHSVYWVCVNLATGVRVGTLALHRTQEAARAYWVTRLPGFKPARLRALVRLYVKDEAKRIQAAAQFPDVWPWSRRREMVAQHRHA